MPGIPGFMALQGAGGGGMIDKGSRRSVNGLMERRHLFQQVQQRLPPWCAAVPQGCPRVVRLGSGVGLVHTLTPLVFGLMLLALRVCSTSTKVYSRIAAGTCMAWFHQPKASPAKLS